MSALNMSRNILAVLLHDLLIQELSRYTKVWDFFFWKDTLHYGIQGNKVKNLLWLEENVKFPPTIRQVVIHCRTHNIEANMPNDIANGLLCSSLTMKTRNSITNIYINIHFYPVTSEKSHKK